MCIYSIHVFYFFEQEESTAFWPLLWDPLSQWWWWRSHPTCIYTRSCWRYLGSSRPHSRSPSHIYRTAWRRSSAPPHMGEHTHPPCPLVRILMALVYMSDWRWPPLACRSVWARWVEVISPRSTARTRCSSWPCYCSWSTWSTSFCICPRRSRRSM